MGRILRILRILRIHRLIRASIFVLFLFSSCDPSMIFEDSRNLPAARWESAEALKYEENITDTTGIHNILITTRNRGDYQYSNLFLFITTTSPTGAQLRDTLEITLADADGHWRGSGLGDLHYLRTGWRKNVRFPYPGVYTFSVIHGMREQELRGIGDVGIRIEKAKN